MKEAISILVLSLCSSMSWAGVAECPVSSTEPITNKCRSTVLRLMQSDPLVRSLRQVLAKNLGLKNCQFQSADKLEAKYVPPGAQGAYLDVSTFVSCEGAGIDGFDVTGSFFLDETAPSFQFVSLTVSTYE